MTAVMHPSRRPWSCPRAYCWRKKWRRRDRGEKSKNACIFIFRTATSLSSNGTQAPFWYTRLRSDGTVFFTFVAFFLSVHWYCWLGHLTCKTVSQITYTVLVETLNPAQSINRWNSVFSHEVGLSERLHRTRISDKTDRDMWSHDLRLLQAPVLMTLMSTKWTCVSSVFGIIYQMTKKTYLTSKIQRSHEIVFTNWQLNDDWRYWSNCLLVCVTTRPQVTLLLTCVLCISTLVYL